MIFNFIRLFKYGSILLLFFLSACGECNKSTKEATTNVVSVTTVLAAPLQWQPTLRLSGTLTARENIAVGTPLQGLKIIAVETEVGKQVKQGQILARLESINVQSQLQQNEAMLVKAKANLGALEATQTEAVATLRRYQSLSKSEAISHQELDIQKAKVASGKANIQVAKAEIAQMEAQINDSRNQRDKANILAPVDGVVIKRHAEKGALTDSNALFNLATHGEIELSVEGDVIDLSQLTVNMPAQIYVHGRSEMVSGKVRLILPEIDSTSRLGKVLITLDNYLGLTIGTYGEASFQLPVYSAKVAVPVQAIVFEQKNVTSVFVVDEQNKLTRRIVSLGQRQHGEVEVLSGLKPGEQVVRQAAAFLNEGDVINPQLTELEDGI